IYKEKLQGTYVKTVAGNVLMTGKGGGELRGWAGNRPLLAETIPFIPQILRSATEYEDEPLSKDRKGDFYAFRKFQALQKLPSGSTVKGVVSEFGI
ncbi:hypothetical protein, partial [Macromonas bipunctata]|uniref:hypothetical protein n=1 Tax=Macromonas bipunctata TaxID=183670 RepID=UPI0014752209